MIEVMAVVICWLLITFALAWREINKRIDDLEERTLKALELTRQQNDGFVNCFDKHHRWLEGLSKTVASLYEDIEDDEEQER